MRSRSMLFRPVLLSLPFPWVNSVLAAFMLIVIVFATLLMWPICFLGFAWDPNTYLVTRVDSGGPAAQAGLQVGDQVVELYNQPISEVLSSINLVDLIGSHNQPVPIVVKRGEQSIAMAMEQGQPALSFQLAKLAWSGLALACWITGYWLGVVRRHELPGSPLVGMFWLGLSGVTGSMFFAQTAAIPIYIGLLWVLNAVFAPLTIYIHLLFPPRESPTRTERSRSGAYLLGISICISSGITIGAVLNGMSLVGQLDMLAKLLPFTIVGALGSSAWLLHRAYRRTTNAKTRRQIRLIVVACLSVTLILILLFVIPDIILGRNLVPGRELAPLLGSLVPLAYLAGARSSNLYRLDRVAARFLVHLVTSTALITFLSLTSTLLALRSTGTVTWIAVAFVALYRPVQHRLLRVLPANFAPKEEYRALEDTISGLTYTLETPALITTLVNGVQAQFGQPALAFFLGDVNGTDELTLQIHQRMADLPQTLPPGALTDQLRCIPSVAESRMVRREVGVKPLTMDEQRLLAHPSVVLWCPIRHVQGHLLGLLVLGMRGDLDDYRDHDQGALQRLINAASLALANSAAYAQLVEAEGKNRQLLQRVEAVQDATANDIALELHDEVINGFVRLNVQDLEWIRAQLHDPILRDKLTMTIESEHELIAALRTICSRLHPPGLNDPLGLPGVLRNEVMRVQERWAAGTCRLEITGGSLPITPTAQYQALRITKEALANAVKHADASTIIVHLQYPPAANEWVRLMIRDNGRNAGAVVERRGHLGLFSMRERARAAGGRLVVQSETGGYTSVEFTFPADTASTAGRTRELAAYE